MANYRTCWFWHSNNNVTDSHYYVMSLYDDSQHHPSVHYGSPQPNAASAFSLTYSNTEGDVCVAIVDEEFKVETNLWYVLVDEDASFPPMKKLLAFADSRLDDGTVITLSRAQSLGVIASEACGFLQWFSSSNELQQILVNKEYRQRGLSRKLISVADILIVSDVKWNGKFLTGGTITTNDGEKLRSAWQESGSKRVIPRAGSVTN